MEALISHLQTTLRMHWGDPPEAIAAALDRLHTLPFARNGEHEAFLRDVDFPAHDDFPREADYLKALVRMRQLADRGPRVRPVTFEEMTELQAIVLAAAADGARGPCVPGLAEPFARKIGKDLADRAHPVAKAVRLYLDFLWFRPFRDGNARAARLWFEYVLRRHGIANPSYRAIARFRLRPGDVWGYWALLAMVAADLLPRGRASFSAPRRRAAVPLLRAARP